MTSKPSGGANGDGSKGKNKVLESKFYSRKTLTKSSKKTPQISSSSSQNPQFAVPSNRDPPSMDGFVTRLENRVTINLSSRLKQDLREIRRKLTNELDQVRNLVKKLEAKESQISGYSGAGYSHSQLSTNYANGSGGAKRMKSKVPLHRLNISTLEDSQGGTSEIVQKEKRTSKGNQQSLNSEVLVGKEKFLPPDGSKKSKLNGGKKRVESVGVGGGGAAASGGGGEEGNFGFGKNKNSGKIFKSCNDLLTKLMKHKHGWVFNTPVDVKGLGLRDYYVIIKHPMDLGTVKTRLNKNGYKSPMDFAEDVKLTFHNAMTYNRKGQDVHIMAEELLKIFEDKWVAIQSQFNLDSRFGGDQEVAIPYPSTKKTPLPPPEVRRSLDRSESTTRLVESEVKSSDVPPPPPPPPTRVQQTTAPKKPKVNDLNKRDMTYEEKQRLSTSLQSLPMDKLDNIVQIIKNRNSSLFQNDDEIEVDIDSVDTETLWELDRFVINYKKGLSKKKRKAETTIQPEEPKHEDVETDPAPIIADAQNETKTVPDADEKNASSSSPVQAEKQGATGSRSSSSSSSSSGSGSDSSDSDSDSSSATD